MRLSGGRRACWLPFQRFSGQLNNNVLRVSTGQQKLREGHTAVCHSKAQDSALGGATRSRTEEMLAGILSGAALLCGAVI